MMLFPLRPLMQQSSGGRRMLEGHQEGTSSRFINHIEALLNVLSPRHVLGFSCLFPQLTNLCVLSLCVFPLSLSVRLCVPHQFCSPACCSRFLVAQSSPRLPFGFHFVFTGWVLFGLLSVGLVTWTSQLTLVNLCCCAGFCFHLQ